MPPSLDPRPPKRLSGILMQLKTVSSPATSHVSERTSASTLASSARMARSDETIQQIDTSSPAGPHDREADKVHSLAADTTAKDTVTRGATPEAAAREEERDDKEDDEAGLREHPRQTRRHFRDLLHHRGERRDRIRKRDKARMVGHQLHSAFKSWFKDVSWEHL